MSEPLTITAKLPAWLYYFYSVDEFMDAVQADGGERAMSMLSFSAQDHAKGEKPYTQIGEAEITVTLHSRDALVANQIAGLQTMLKHERAETVKRQNAIKDRISKLQAITYDAEA